MNAKTRALNAMEGLSVDRVPVMLYRHFPEQDADNSVGAYIKWARESKVDMLLLQCDGNDGCPIENVTGTTRFQASSPHQAHASLHCPAG